MVPQPRPPQLSSCDLLSPVGGGLVAKAAFCIWGFLAGPGALGGAGHSRGVGVRSDPRELVHGLIPVLE